MLPSWTSSRAGTVDAYLAVASGVLCLLVPVTPGTQLESGVACAVLHAFAIGFAIGAIRYGESGVRVTGIVVLILFSLLFLALLTQAYVHRNEFFSY